MEISIRELKDEFEKEKKKKIGQRTKNGKQWYIDNSFSISLLLTSIAFSDNTDDITIFKAVKMPQLLRNLCAFHLILLYLLVNVKHCYIFAEKQNEVKNKWSNRSYSTILYLQKKKKTIKILDQIFQIHRFRIPMTREWKRF